MVGEHLLDFLSHEHTTTALFQGLVRPRGALILADVRRAIDEDNAVAFGLSYPDDPEAWEKASAAARNII